MGGRYAAASATIGGRLYICGGSDSTQQALSSVESYNPSTGSWEVLPSLAQGRYTAAAAVIAGRLYICGGCDAKRVLSSTERYTPTTGVWEVLPPLAQGRSHVAGTACVIVA